MQGQRSSTSGDTGIGSQMSWNNVQTSVPNLLPEYMIPFSDPNILYLHHISHGGQNSEWSVGQTSSSAAENPADQNDGKTEHTWNIHSGAALNLEGHHYQPSNTLSSDIGDMHPNGNHFPNESFLVNNSSSVTLPQDLNMSSGYENNEDDECQVIERPNTSISIGSLNDQRTSTRTSSDSLRPPSGSSGIVMGGSERTTVPLDDRCISRKRKAFEVAGQSSGAGSSNRRQHTERSQRHAVSAAQISISNNGASAQAERNHTVNNGSEQSIARLRLGGESVTGSPFSLTASGTPESSHRSFRLNSNGSQQQDSVTFYPFSIEADDGNVEFSLPRRSSRSVARNRYLNSNPAPEAENGNVHGQSVLMRGPSAHLISQSSRNGVSNSRTNRSSTSSISGGRDGVTYEDSVHRNVPRNISEHPMFVPARERRSSALHPMNWNFAAGSSSISGNAASSSLVGSSSGINSSASSWMHRSYPQYSRRLSEIVRRSLISSTGTESGGQSSNHPVRSGSSATSQEAALVGSGNHGHHTSNSRSALFERHLEGGFMLPYSMRTLASAGEGRSSMMSEIRHVLDLMRRGESLRSEDMMILDHPLIFGMVDFHDRHRDMRLDVDNMSYEELLALEERIGSVNTGLNEEAIVRSLKTHKYVNIGTENEMEAEPCSICREEYAMGEDLGKLECGHDFHKDCIKQWLMQKNVCPICKTAGLTA